MNPVAFTPQFEMPSSTASVFARKDFVPLLIDVETNPRIVSIIYQPPVSLSIFIIIHCGSNPQLTDKAPPLVVVTLPVFIIASSPSSPKIWLAESAPEANR